MRTWECLHFDDLVFKRGGTFRDKLGCFSNSELESAVHQASKGCKRCAEKSVRRGVSYLHGQNFGLFCSPKNL